MSQQPPEAKGGIRLNRAIASSGLCSRRKADELIAAGRVMLNGQSVTDFHHSVDPARDEILVDGKPLKSKAHVYVALHKPRGVVTTCEDERGRKTVLDLLPADLRHVKPVGRLDRESEGLIILTNDGDVAFSMTHPSRHVWKRYRLTVKGRITDKALRQLADGVELDDGITLPCDVTVVAIDRDRSVLEISIREGRNRQLRRMCDSIGYPVIRLLRVAIGRLQLKPMGPGDWKVLSKQEVDRCFRR